MSTVHFDPSFCQKLATRAVPTLLLVTLLVAASTPLAAQPDAPPGPPPEHAVRVVAHFLELSETQIESWVEILQGLHESVHPLAAAAAERHQELGALVESDAADPAAVGSLVLEIRDLHRQIHALYQRAATDFEDLLEPEQAARLATAREIAPVARLLPAFRALHLL